MPRILPPVTYRHQDPFEHHAKHVPDPMAMRWVLPTTPLNKRGTSEVSPASPPEFSKHQLKREESAAAAVVVLPVTLLAIMAAMKPLALQVATTENNKQKWDYDNQQQSFHQNKHLLIMDDFRNRHHFYNNHEFPTVLKADLADRYHIFHHVTI